MILSRNSMTNEVFVSNQAKADLEHILYALIHWRKGGLEEDMRITMLQTLLKPSILSPAFLIIFLLHIPNTNISAHTFTVTAATNKPRGTLFTTKMNMAIFLSIKSFLTT